MNGRVLILVLVVALLAIVALGSLDATFLRGLDDTQDQGTGGGSSVAPRRDFMFQVDGFEAEGQTIDMYFHYRYDQGIATQNIPDFRDLRSDAIGYMNDNAEEGVYWETLSRGVCSRLMQKYPIQAISCQLRVHPGRDPGFSSSIHTIGAIEPLAIPGPSESSSSGGS